MTRKYDKGDQPSDGETTSTNTGATRSGRGQHTIGKLRGSMLRHSPNHGTVRLPNEMTKLKKMKSSWQQQILGLCAG